MTQQTKPSFIARIFNNLKDAKKYARKKGYRIIFETSEGRWLGVEEISTNKLVCHKIVCYTKNMEYNKDQFDRIKLKAEQSVKICELSIKGKTETEIAKELKVSRQLCEYYFNVLRK